MSKESSVIEEAQAVIECAHTPGCTYGCSADMEECPLDNLPEEELLYELADLFKIFADTTRIKILYALMSGPLSVSLISKIVGAQQSAVSHQLRILKQAHLVKFYRDGKNVFYSLADDHVHTMLDQGMSHVCE